MNRKTVLLQPLNSMFMRVEGKTTLTQFWGLVERNYSLWSSSENYIPSSTSLLFAFTSRCIGSIKSGLHSWFVLFNLFYCSHKELFTRLTLFMDLSLHLILSFSIQTRLGCLIRRYKDFLIQIIRQFENPLVFIYFSVFSHSNQRVTFFSLFCLLEKFCLNETPI